MSAEGVAGLTSQLYVESLAKSTLLSKSVVTLMDEQPTTKKIRHSRRSLFDFFMLKSLPFMFESLLGSLDEPIYPFGCKKDFF
jgi:hypothetical protein